jgi:hypothetical protein
MNSFMILRGEPFSAVLLLAPPRRQGWTPETIDNVKLKILGREGIPPDEQRLISALLEASDNFGGQPEL